MNSESEVAEIDREIADALRVRAEHEQDMQRAREIFYEWQRKRSSGEAKNDREKQLAYTLLNSHQSAIGEIDRNLEQLRKRRKEILDGTDLRKER